MNIRVDHSDLGANFSGLQKLDDQRLVSKQFSENSEFVN